MGNFTVHSLCENKGTDQLCSNCTAGQRLCVRQPDSIIPFSEISSLFKYWFAWNLVGMPENLFSSRRGSNGINHLKLHHVHICISLGLLGTMT